MNPLRKFRAAASALGWGNAAFLAAHRALGSIGGAVHRYCFVAQPVPSHPFLDAARGRSIEVRLVAPEDPALAAMPLTRAVIDRRTSQGAVCFGAFKGSSMIGCLWLCFDQFEEDEVRCRFELHPRGRVAWDFDIYLLPEHRLGVGFAKLWDAANGYMRDRGVGWTISRISHYNPKSLFAHRRLGAVSIGEATFICCRAVQIGILSFSPYILFSAQRASMATLTLQPPATGVIMGSATTLARDTKPADG